MRLLNAHISEIFIHTVLVLCLMFFWGHVHQAEAAVPGPATLLSPSGTIFDVTPTYTWNAVVNSEWYILWVGDSTGTVFFERYTREDAGCGDGTGTCSVTPTTELSVDNYSWAIQTFNYGWLWAIE